MSISGAKTESAAEMLVEDVRLRFGEGFGGVEVGIREESGGWRVIVASERSGERWGEGVAEAVDGGKRIAAVVGVVFVVKLM
jgi:hypothetical protein